MLRACRRLLKPGGRLAFYTIFIPEGLSEDAYRRAVLAGPPEVAVRQDHEAMLRSAGFVRITEADVTDEHLRVALARLQGWDRHAAALRRAHGEAEFSRLQTDRRAAVAAIKAGLLRRSLFVARRPT